MRRIMSSHAEEHETEITFRQLMMIDEEDDDDGEDDGDGDDDESDGDGGDDAAESCKALFWIHIGVAEEELVDLKYLSKNQLILWQNMNANVSPR